MSFLRSGLPEIGQIASNHTAFIVVSVHDRTDKNGDVPSIMERLQNARSDGLFSPKPQIFGILYVSWAKTKTIMKQNAQNGQRELTPSAHRRHIHDASAAMPLTKRVGKFWHQLGPGLTTGAADDDPSGIATYSQTGSRYGYQLLWLAIFTFPFMTIVQEMCARIGLVTGRGLATNIRLHFPRWVLYLCAGLLFFANTLNIGADLGAMAAATQLISPQMGFGLLLIIFTVVTLLLQLFTSYARYARILKWLSLALLAYVFTALTLRDINWAEVLRGIFIPSLSVSREQIILLCGIFGTTISPYLFFWQTSQEVEEEILEGKTTIAARRAEVNATHIHDMRTDVWSGMLFSNLVMFFIILACGAVLHTAGITNITSAAEAAEALRPFAGSGATLLFAAGVVGIGLLAVPVLAGSAAYAITESFRWKEGLYRKLKDAYAFYGVIVLSTIAGLGLHFFGLNPIKALIFAAVANGLVAPIVLVLIVRLASDGRIMGTFVNSRVIQIFGWLITGIMVLVALAAIIAVL